MSKDIVDNYRAMFESRIFVERTEKLPCSESLRISSWSYQQLYKVSTPCIDDHHFKEEEMKSVGELSQVCS